MAGRKDKNVVDYFPHQCEHGKTLFILENKYPFKGYCVWFKTLELLGKSENHFIDCRKKEDWEFMSAYMKLSPTELQEIYDTCAGLGAIHKELWENKVIWSINFLKGIADVYRRRQSKMMDFLTLIEFLSISCHQQYDRNGIIVNGNGINDDRNTQSKVKESKVKENIKEEEETFEKKEEELTFEERRDRQANQMAMEMCGKKFNELNYCQREPIIGSVERDPEVDRKTEEVFARIDEHERSKELTPAQKKFFKENPDFEPC